MRDLKRENQQLLQKIIYLRREVESLKRDKDELEKKNKKLLEIVLLPSKHMDEFVAGLN